MTDDDRRKILENLRRFQEEVRAWTQEQRDAYMRKIYPWLDPQ